MAGIERLRRAARMYRNGGKMFTAKLLDDIADQIEREITPQERRDEPVDGHAKYVSVSAYDLTPADEREAIAWVREHGGLDHVREEWRSRSNLKRMYEKEKAKVERQQRHIEFVQGKCRERQEHIVDLNKKVEEMSKRLMPEGMELNGSVLKIRIAENVDYDGETLFVLIGGRDE